MASMKKLTRKALISEAMRVIAQMRWSDLGEDERRDATQAARDARAAARAVRKVKR